MATRTWGERASCPAGYLGASEAGEHHPLGLEAGVTGRVVTKGLPRAFQQPALAISGHELEQLGHGPGP
jgi:hypothetical protein